MIHEKIAIIGFSFASTYFLTEFSIYQIFPLHIFSYQAFIYGFIANLIYSLLELYRRQKKFVEKVEGVSPFTKDELILKAFRPLMSAIFNVVVFAVLTSYAMSNPNWVFAENIKYLQTKEGTILVGLILGFGFEYITSDASASMLKRQIREWVKSLLAKLG
jgi:hypothetical protein